MNIFRRMIGIRSTEEQEPAEPAQGDSTSAYVILPFLDQDVAGAATSAGREGHEDEIEIFGTTWHSGPTVGAAQTLTVGSAQSTSGGATESQDESPAQSAAGDPDRPFVVGSVPTPGPSDDARVMEVSGLKYETDQVEVLPEDVGPAEELADPPGVPDATAAASPKLMEAIATGTHTGPEPDDATEALTSSPGDDSAYQLNVAGTLYSRPTSASNGDATEDGGAASAASPGAGLRSDGDLVQASAEGRGTEHAEDLASPTDDTAPMKIDGFLKVPDIPGETTAYVDGHEIEMDVHVGAAPPLVPDGLVGPQTDGPVLNLGPGELAQASESASEPVSTHDWTRVHESIQPVSGVAEASPELAGPTDSDATDHPDFAWVPRTTPPWPADTEVGDATDPTLGESADIAAADLTMKGSPINVNAPDAAPDTMALGESPEDSAGMTKAELINVLNKSFDPASEDAPSTMVELGDTSETGATIAQYGESDLGFVSRHLEASHDGDELEDPEL